MNTLPFHAFLGDEPSLGHHASGLGVRFRFADRARFE